MGAITSRKMLRKRYEMVETPTTNLPQKILGNTTIYENKYSDQANSGLENLFLKSSKCGHSDNFSIGWVRCKFPTQNYVVMDETPSTNSPK